MEGRPGRLTDWQIVLRTLGYLRPHWRRVSMAAVAMFAMAGVAVGVPWLVKLALDSYIGPGDLSGLNLILLAFVLLALVQFAITYVHTRLPSCWPDTLSLFPFHSSFPATVIARARVHVTGTASSSAKAVAVGRAMDAMNATSIGTIKMFILFTLASPFSCCARLTGRDGQTSDLASVDPLKALAKRAKGTSSLGR